MYDNPDPPKTHTVYIIFQVRDGTDRIPNLTVIDKVATQFEAEELILRLRDMASNSVGRTAQFKYIKAEVVK